MNTRITQAFCLTFLTFLSFVPSVAHAGEAIPDAVIPVAGTTAGAAGSNFRTEAQLHNPTDTTMRGRLVFVYQGIPIQPNPPAELTYELAPRQTMVYEDLVAMMGGNGLGSIDVFVEAGLVPDMMVRVFDDKGEEGTTGLIVPVLPIERALVKGQNAVLIVPADLDRYRFNIGVRTLPSDDPTALMRIVVHDPSGQEVGEEIVKDFPSFFFAQAEGEDFLGRALIPGSSLFFEIESGRVILYSTTTDNTTNDGSIQIDRILNLPPVVDPAEIHVSTPAATAVSIPVSVSDPDDDVVTGVISGTPSHGSVEMSLSESTDLYDFTYTPEAGFEGEDAFAALFDDGNGGTAELNVGITVGGGNNAPIALANSYTITEGETLSVVAPGVLSNDTDVDGDTLSAVLIDSPASAAIFALNADGSFTYSPVAGFVGTDQFTYRADDGQATSAVAVVRISVKSLNTPPNAVADTATTDEDTPIMIAVLANDTDAETPGQISITGLSTAGTLGTVSIVGTQISYDPTTSPTLQALKLNQSAVDTFQYTIRDPEGLVSTTTVTVTVAGVDDPTVVANDSLTILEDAGATAVDVLANDSDPDDTLIISGVTQGASGTVVITGGGTGLTYQPDPDACGADSFTYTVNGMVGTVNVTVTCVNDAPSFTKGVDQTVNEDAGAQTVNGWATAISAGAANEAGQTLAFNVTGNDNAAIFSAGPAIDASGNLTYTPAADAFGVANITITLSDDGGTANGGVDTSASQSFVITVNAVNDVPSFTKGADQEVLEDAGAQTVNGWATAISVGPANESSQTPTFSVVGNTNPGAFAVLPAISPTGVLTYTMAPDVSSGACAISPCDAVATITISLLDDGGTANGGVDTSATQSFFISVLSVNDAPSFTKGADQSVGDNAGAQSVANWATSISAGPANESGQTLTFNVTGNTNPGIFSVAPAISSTGTLTYTPATVSGTVSSTITITLSDNGGTLNGGVNTSAPQSFTITISHVNAPPALIASPKESFDTIGNTAFEFKATQALTPSVFVSGNLVSNFTDSDGPSALTLSGIVGCGDVTSPYDCSTTNGGTVSVTSAGEFTFTPKDGDTNASDTFQYTVTDGATPVSRTVTINRQGRVWYVKNDATAGGLGRSTDPFDTLVEAETASIAGDTIYVYRGDGFSTGQGAGITLKANQRLLGQGVALTVPVAVNGGSSPTTLLAAGSQPTIGNSGGDGVSVTDVAGVEIRGLKVFGSGNAIDVTTSAANSGGATITNNTIDGAEAEGIDVNAVGTGTMTLVITDNAWNGAGTHTGNAIDIRRSSGAGAMSLDLSRNTGIVSNGAGIFIDGQDRTQATITGFASNTVSGNTVGDGISVSQVNFSAASGGTTTVGASGNAVGVNGMQLVNVSGSLTFADLSSYSGAGIAIGVAGGAPMTFVIQNSTNASIANATGGAAVSFLNVGSTVTLASATSASSSGLGIDLDTVSGTFTLNGGATITSPTGIGIRVNNSTATLSFGTTSITSRGSAGINIVGGSTTTSFGATTIGVPGAGGGSSAVAIDNTTAGSVTFSSLAVNNNGGAGSAFAASGNAGSITVTTGSLQGSSGATVSVSSGTGNVNMGASITNTSGRAVQVLNNTGGTKTFSGAITDNGGQGIFANSNTGATMNFTGGVTLSTATNAAFTATGGGTVSVTGSANTLTTTTGTALNVATTSIGASGLTFRSISSNGAVNGIVLNTTGSSGGLTVTGTGAAGTGGTIQSSTGAGVSLSSTSGVSLTSMNVTGGASHGISGSSVTGLMLASCSVTNNGDAATEHGVTIANLLGTSSFSSLVVTGSADRNVSIINSSGTLSSLVISGSTMSNTNVVLGNQGLYFETNGTATATSVSVTGSTFSTNRTTGIQVQANDTSTIGGFTVSASTFTGNNIAMDFDQAGAANLRFTISNNTTITGQNSHALNVFTSSSSTGGTLNGIISGNTIGNSGVASSGSAVGNGIRVNINGQTDANVSISNNNIRQVPQGRGIEVIGRDGTGGLDVTILGNDVNPQDTSGFPLAAIYVESNTSNTVRSDVRNNTVPAGSTFDSLSTYLAVRENGTSTSELVNTSSAADATTQLTNTNTGSASASAGVALIAGPINTP